MKDRLHRAIGVRALFFVDWIVIDVGCSPLRPFSPCMEDRWGSPSLFTGEFCCDIFSSQQFEVVVGEMESWNFPAGKSGKLQRPLQIAPFDVN